jgi:isocitrate dehydrogenase
MKLTDGLFLEVFYEVAKEYPELKADDVIVDDLCMKLVTRPDLFDTVVLTNLQGDIVSDLCAGLVGGLGFAPSANIGDHISILRLYMEQLQILWVKILPIQQRCC